jgi:hypothetical protein
MPDYAVYGGILRSTIELPELRPVDDAEQVSSDQDRVWSYSQPPPGSSAQVELTELGKELIYGGVHARLCRFDGGYRVVVDDTGAFDISEDGTVITGYPLELAWPDFVRAHLIGRVLSTAMYLQGALTLHGSAVVIDGRAVAFLAPKHHGKTTLALALTRAGASLLTDDTLPIDVHSASAMAGVHAMRLHQDTASLLAGAGHRPRTREGKEILNHMPDAWKYDATAALDAVYLLAPAATLADGGVVDRQPLPGGAAAVSVVGHAKIAEMLGRWGAQTLLEQAVLLTSRVPVYRLAVVRDLDVLPTVVDQFGKWHGQHLVWDSRLAEHR